MNDVLKNQALDEKELYLAFSKMKQNEYQEAQDLLEKGYDRAVESDNQPVQGVYLSAQGLLLKLQGDFKKAYKIYQKAEKLLKDDPSIKIITATLLIDQFKQFDTAVIKLDKVLASEPDPGVKHHALSLKARALFGLGKKKQAKECFEDLLTLNFESLGFAANLDFQTAQFFVGKAFETDLVKDYLKKSLTLAQEKNEKALTAVIQALIDQLEKLES